MNAVCKAPVDGSISVQAAILAGWMVLAILIAFCWYVWRDRR